MDMSEQACIFKTLRDRWIKAFAARDLDGLAGLYSPDALFFGSTPLLFRGHEDVRAYFSGLARDIALDSFEEPELLPVSGEVFVTAGFWRFRFGSEPRLYRLTWVIAMRDGGWRIVQHHAARCDL